MSVMEKIFGNFMSRQAAPAPVQQNSNNLQEIKPSQTTQQSAVTAPNGVVPAGSNASAPQSPLEQFKEVWQPNKEDSTSTPQNFNADPQKIMEAASKVNFAQILDKDSLAKVQAGGEEAVTALVGLLNQTAQAVYGQSTVAASKIVEQALSQAEQKFASQVPSLVNKKAAQAKLLTENKALADPAVAPLVAMIQDQLATKYPNATSDELAEMAQGLMKGAAQVFSPAPPPEQQKAGKKEDDWSDFLN